MRRAHHALLVGFALVFAVATPATADRLGGRAALTAPGSSKAASSTSQRPGALRLFLARNLRIRASVAGLTRTTREQAKAGLIGDAARTITAGRARIAPRGLAERISMWRGERAVKRAAFKAANTRSKAGDNVGTRDALDGIATLSAAGRFGVYSQWKAARAEGKAFSRALGNAKAAAKLGDLETALDSQGFAAELRGEDHRKVRGSAEKIMNRSLEYAAKRAKDGDSQGAWQALQYGTLAAERAGVAFPADKGNRIMDRAFERSIPVLTKIAGQQYKFGNHASAAQALFEALEIQNSMNMKPGMLDRMRQRKLVQKLAPRLRELAEAKRAEAEAANAAEASASAEGGGEAPTVLP